MVRETNSWREPLNFERRNNMNTIWESMQGTVLKLYNEGEVV